MRHLTIYRHYFRDSDCYQTATVQEQRGVQVHCTIKGASYLKRWVGPDDGRLGKNRYGNHHNRPGGDVCAHAYIGKLEDGTVACYQALPWDYRCWLSGSAANGNANRLGYIGFEIAADNLDDEEYFRAAVMSEAVNLAAHLCTMMGVSPDTVLGTYKQGDALAVMDHSELHRLKLASNHMDIGHWLQAFELSMYDFRVAVEDAMEEGVEVTYIEAMPDIRPTLRKGSRGEDVRELQMLLNTDRRYGGLEVDGVYGSDTLSSVRAFQGDNGLTPDGICGPETWAALALFKGTLPPGDETPKDTLLTVEERLARLETAVFGEEGGGSVG